MSWLAHIDETGFHAPDYETILEDLKKEYRGIYGDDVYLEEDSQDGEWIAIEALARYDAILMAESVYRSYSPATARGVGLSSAVKINGISRDASSHSTAPIRLVGQIGTIITDGMVGGDTDVKWLLPSPIIIPPTGEILAVATADKPGDHRAAPGDIYRILTPTRGWQDAVNTKAATPGSPVEEDGTLRQRQKKSTALPSLTILDGTIGAVANVKGVTRCQDYENDTDITDANGLPPHSISVVAKGGDPTEIANAINIKKTPGCGTYGTKRVLVTDPRGMPKYINYFIATEMRFKARIRIIAHAGYKAATALRIRENVAEYVNTMRIGMDILRSRLICPISQAEAETGARTFDVDLDSLAIGADDGALATENITVPFNALMEADVNDIEVVVDRTNA